jgi:hypothetical protein
MKNCRTAASERNTENIPKENTRWTTAERSLTLLTESIVVAPDSCGSIYRIDTLTFRDRDGDSRGPQGARGARL